MEIYRDCDPTICDQKDLLSRDLIFMSNLIKDQCECINKSTCMRIIELLKSNKVEEAEDYFTKYMK